MGGAMIPQRLHFIWTGPEPMPAWAEANLERFRELNPEFEVAVHGEGALLPKYESVYEQLRCASSRSDLLRYSVLQRHGGWYFDLDFYPMRPLADVVRAYELSGDTMFVSRQAGQKNPKLVYANAPLAAEADWLGWELIDEIVLSRKPPYGRTAFGPELIVQAVRKRPRLFTVADTPWFFPAAEARARRVWAALGTASDDRYARRLCPGTGGQLPFAMHLWANGSPDLAVPPRKVLAKLDGNPDGPFAGRRACLAALPIQWDDTTQPFQAIAQGLAAAGFTVVVADLEDAPQELVTSDLLALWNGRKSTYGQLAASARRFGLPVLCIEHGFFDRRAHVQIDHEGILHWASWRREFKNPAPAEGAERLACIWPRPLDPFHKRRDGYVLVIGQLRGDSQLAESEITIPADLERLVARSVPEGVGAVFRPHPKARRQRSNHLPLCKAATLEEAVCGARFAVMVNSNSGNECLALGCPVLCFGPALYAQAGVARQTTVKAFRKDLTEMLAGWRPDEPTTRNYLHWLACRQWNADDLADGRVLAELARRAFA